MPLIVRRGDAGSHGGSVVTGAEKWRAEGAAIARVGDLYACPLHGVNPIVEGSPRWRCEDADIARHGDRTACGAALISDATKWRVD